MRRPTIVLVVLLVIVGTVSPAVALGTASGSAGTVSTDDCSFPVTETDATGTEITLEDAPERVVTLNPSAAQTMWEIGAEEKVVGVTKHAMNLEGAAERTNISTDADTIEPERVVDLEPDLVLAPGSNYVGEELVEVLREAGLTVYYYPSADSIDTVRDQTHLVGSLVGECDGAEETVEWMDHEIEIVESALEGEERPDVVYEFFAFTAGNETFIHEILEAAGGTNIAAEAGISGYELLSEETVVDADPDWLVLNSNSPEVPDSEAFASTTAVEEDQVVVVDINHLNRPGPRIVYGITTLAETFHPEAYAEALSAAETEAEQNESAQLEVDASESDSDSDENESSDSTSESTETDENESASTADDDSDGSPGFGATIALAAVVLATLGAIHYREERA